MELHNYLIVGSGPAGVSAALTLSGCGTVVIDSGESADSAFHYDSLDDALSAGDIKSLLGTDWECLETISDPKHIHPKLRVSALRSAVNGESFKLYNSKNSYSLTSQGSYARGGMSSVWGGQLLRYTQTDLDEVGGWPITADQLDPYYESLEKHIGISGSNDHMSAFLGNQTNLLPPSPLVPAAKLLLDRYHSLSDDAHRMGMKMGRARLAILTESFRDYPKYKFNDTEFYSPAPAGLYSAKRTLDELISRNLVDYIPGLKVLKYREQSDFVEIEAAVAGFNEVRRIRARHLLLACGTIHTAKLVLQNEQLLDRSLPFLDHPPTTIPFFLPAMFGKNIPASSFPIQLIASLRESEATDFITFYQPSSLLWSDMLYDVPLPLNSARRLLQLVLPGMLIAQIWRQTRPTAENLLFIQNDGSIRVDYPTVAHFTGISQLLAGMRVLGAYSMKRLASPPEPGWGFHYAGTLPMRNKPGILQTYTDCRLWNSKRIRVIDGSVLPALPAKNHSLTIMANAARVADLVKDASLN
jgi:choline dehydrogenase-like flavoprotein